MNKLENNLILIYTGINRTAHKIASSYVSKLTKDKKNYIKEILDHVDIGENLLKSGDINDFGRLLNESWVLKKKLSKSITNKKIDELYNHALKFGALGGKLLGAGGGGFFLFYVPYYRQKEFIKYFHKLINVPFKFSSKGSEIMLKNN